MTHAFPTRRSSDLKEFQELVRRHVDILFANEQEIVSLFEVESFDEALQAVRFEVETAALTRSQRGSVVSHRAAVPIRAADPPVRVPDTTGAGDLHARGYLKGSPPSLQLSTCTRGIRN